MPPKKTSLPLEKDTRNAVANFFKSQGYVVQMEYKTPYGFIDILIKEYKPNGELIFHIIECKRRNDSNSIKSSIGQLICYAKHFPEAQTQLYFCTNAKNPLSPEAARVIASNPDILYKVF
jgi:Holliday junction resolvase-like predicted endonuclease